MSESRVFQDVSILKYSIFCLIHFTTDHLQMGKYVYLPQPMPGKFGFHFGLHLTILESSKHRSNLGPSENILYTICR